MSSVSPTKAQPDLVRVECQDGKYTVVQAADGGLRALRYGEEWRDCCGDGMILALAQDLAEARQRVRDIEAVCDTLKRKADGYEAALLEIDSQAVCAVLATEGECFDMLQNCARISGAALAAQ